MIRGRDVKIDADGSYTNMGVIAEVLREDYSIKV